MQMIYIIRQLLRRRWAGEAIALGSRTDIDVNCFSFLSSSVWRFMFSASACHSSEVTRSRQRLQVDSLLSKPLRAIAVEYVGMKFRDMMQSADLEILHCRMYWTWHLMYFSCLSTLSERSLSILWSTPHCRTTPGTLINCGKGGIRDEGARQILCYRCRF